MIDIIVIKYALPEFEERCIQSIKLNAPGNHHTLTVFDNYPANINLGKLWNQLIEQSECEHICLLNSDTEVTMHWLPELMTGFLYDPKVRIVGPSTNNCRTKQSSKGGTGYELVDELSGFCYLFPKSHWAQLGGFDESYPFYGQESEFNRRTLLKGYKLCWVKDVFVWHHGGASVKAAEARGEMSEAEERRKGKDKYFGRV